MVIGKVKNRISVMSSTNFVPECRIQDTGNICEFVAVLEGLMEAGTSWPPSRT